ncbi:hypothetical protein DIPPA_15112 [Diplonema papillatum]|nr:hypothetical protein DIPPA_15112 [Diplonema papillatum]
MLHTADACLQHDMPMCGVGGKETEARAFAPGDARSDTEVETQAATIGPKRHKGSGGCRRQ